MADPAMRADELLLVKKLYQKGTSDPALVLVPMLPSYAHLVAPDSNVDTPYLPASLQIDG